MIRPAEELEGKTLPGGWRVVEKVTRKQNATVGCFATGYLVKDVNGSRLGFMKAMDYSAAFNQPNTVDVLKSLTDSYIFERDICLRCRNANLRRVVHAIDYGTYDEYQGHPFGQFLQVEYIVFERADHDIRAHLDLQDKFDVAFALRAIHNVAAALGQLHGVQIAHQDLKPSNVLNHLA